MKQLLWLMLLINPLISVAQKNYRDSGISWANDLTWGQIQQKAKAENKFIFVDAYATWCVPCKKMDKEVYLNDTVADMINQNFISVKIQMDSTDKDNDRIKNWYPIVNSFKKQYSIGGFPSFLFFSSEGKLVYQDMGYKKVSAFVSLAKMALTDPVGKYNKNLEKFKANQLPYLEMPALARESWDKKDKALATIIAQKYKKEYADKLSDEEAYTKDNLFFLAEFSYEVLNSKDRYFKFFLNNPEMADSIINRNVVGKPWKASHGVLSVIIRKEEITDKIYKIYKDGKPIISKKPNWKKIKNSISKKYGNKYLDKYFPDEQIVYYQKIMDWSNFIKFVNVKIKKNNPEIAGKKFGGMFGDVGQLNLYAWILFEGCSNKKLLKNGLPWIDLCLKLEIRENYIDTKANLLYRLGKVSDAITLEEKAVALSNNDKGNVERLQKMLHGLPTWPQK